MPSHCRQIVPVLLALTGLGATHPAWADWRESSGWPMLAAELGGELPDGTGVVVLQAEAGAASSAPFDYLPQAGGPDPFAGTGNYAGVTFHPESGTGTFLDHANSVATRFYSTSGSVAPGIEEVYMITANDFANSVLSDEPPPSFPNGALAKVQNHSWIGSFSNPQNPSDTNDVRVLRKFDYILNRDGVVASVGLRNDAQMAALLGNSYHALVVGNLAGNHSRGGSNTDGNGRMKPDLVVDEVLTSYSTGAVSSASALMVEAARTLGTDDADDPRVIRALLIAGASKNNLPGWQRASADKPYAEIHGAGELNVYDPWKMLNGGRQSFSESAEVGPRGWDFNQSSSGSVRRYYFTVPDGRFANRVSAALVWNRNVTRTGFILFSYGSVTYDLNLRLRKATGFTPGAEIDASTSAVDNVEHVFQRNLPPGEYVLEVSATSNNRDYALAWNVELGSGPRLTVDRVGQSAVVNAENLDPFVTYTLMSSPDLVQEDTEISFRTADSEAATTWSWTDEGPVTDDKFFWLSWTTP